MALKNWLAMHSQAPEGEVAWESFHENSKTRRHEALDARPWQAAPGNPGGPLSFEQYPVVALPHVLAPLEMPLSQALQQRATPAHLERRQLRLEELATLLYSAYGVTRDSEDSGLQRPLRTVPSAGALHPLELFFHTRSVEGLPGGLYHYNPVEHELRRLRDGDLSAKLAAGLAPKQLAVTSSVMLFIVGLFERSTARYGDRGYRFVLLEAGHVAQNVALAATGLGLGCVPVGGYVDRSVDELLGLDGLLQSTVYMAGIGGLPTAPEQAPREEKA
ncbi:MAG TPA: SagB/ThcOx family dehydrogenase [Archangium sp.]|nr:SagB/ThcOx family dehydrogenase [Archangium sp.]